MSDQEQLAKWERKWARCGDAKAVKKFWQELAKARIGGTVSHGVLIHLLTAYGGGRKYV